MKKGLFVLVAAAIFLFAAVYFFKDDTAPLKTGSTVGKQEENALEKQENKDDTLEEEIIMEAQKYRQIKGTVTAITSEETKQSFRIKEANDEFDIIITPETVVVDNQGKAIKLEEGQYFTAFIDITKPMILIYPALYAPDVIVIETEEMGMFKQGKFNKEYISEELQFQLTISEETEIVNLAGENVTADAIVDEDVLVFYSRSTRSIPEQAPINKVIILTGLE